MREFVRGSDAQFAAMKDTLDAHPGQVCRYRDIQLCPGCAPRRCCLDFSHLAEGGYSFSFSPPVQPPPGTPQALRALLRDGFVGPFEALRRALTVTLAPLAEEEEPSFAQPPASPGQEADRPAGQRQARRQAAGQQEQEEPPQPRITNLPDQLPGEQPPPDAGPEALCRAMTGRVVGHTAQLETLCLLAANHIGKVNPQRPLSVLIAGGPGTGKTHTAECLRQALNAQGLEYGLVRVNLNEFKDAIAVNRMVGAAQGYAGYGDRGLVFDPLLKQEQQIVLLDEAEKAHRDVRDMLLQIMDKGQLQLAAPRRGKNLVDFRRAILIFTSNLPIDEAHLSADGTDEALRQMLTEGPEGFKPEFVSRLVWCAYYRPLSPLQQLQVAAACLSAVAAEYGLQLLQADYAALQELLCGQSRFGARVFKSRSEALFGRQFAQGYRQGLRQVNLARQGQGFALLPAPAQEASPGNAAEPSPGLPGPSAPERPDGLPTEEARGQQAFAAPPGEMSPTAKRTVTGQPEDGSVPDGQAGAGQASTPLPPTAWRPAS